MAAEKTISEDGFRDSLKDVVVLIERLKSFYGTIEEFQESCELATTSDIHLKLMMGLVMAKSKK